MQDCSVGGNSDRVQGHVRRSSSTIPVVFESVGGLLGPSFSELILDGRSGAGTFYPALRWSTAVASTRGVHKCAQRREKRQIIARNLVRFDPFAELSALQKQFFSDGMFSPSRMAAFPTTDVYTEDDKRLTVEAHLPNFDNGDVTLNVDQGVLVIQAEKHEKEEDKKKKYVVREQHELLPSHRATGTG